MAEICDPYAGWHGIHHKWAHCRGGEEACLTIELLAVTDAYAYVGVDRSWAAKQGRAIDRGSYIEYFEGDTRWRVYCDGVNTSQDLASIRICYEEAEETPPPIGNADEMAVGDTLLDITLVRLICDKAQAVIEFGGRENLIGHAMKALAINPLIYVGVWWIDSACTKAYIVRADTTIPDHMEEAAKDGAKESHPDATDAEIDEAYDWAREMASRDPRWQECLEDYRKGLTTYEQFLDCISAIINEYMNIKLSEKDFSIDVASIVIAGETEITGTTPKPNQSGKIMAVRKWLGFDWLAGDTEIGTFVSDATGLFATTVTLEEFGVISVYGKIPVALALDPVTKKHTVFVLTWAILALLIIAAALIYDKKTGNIRKMLKR